MLQQTRPPGAPNCQGQCQLVFLSPQTNQERAPVGLRGADGRGPINVDEERLGVGAEASSSQLDRVVEVSGKIENLSPRRNAPEKLRAAGVFTQHDAAPRAHYHIVRPVQDVDAGRFEDQGQGLQGGIIHKYLPDPLVPPFVRKKENLPPVNQQPSRRPNRAPPASRPCLKTDAMVTPLTVTLGGVGSGSPTGTQLTGKGKPGLWPMAVSNPEEVSTLSISRFPPSSARSPGRVGRREGTNRYRPETSPLSSVS